MPDKYLAIYVILSFVLAVVLKRTSIFPRVNWSNPGLSKTPGNALKQGYHSSHSDDDLSTRTAKHSLNSLNAVSPGMVIVAVIAATSFCGWYIGTYILFAFFPAYAELKMTNIILLLAAGVIWAYIAARLTLTFVYIAIAGIIIGFGLYFLSFVVLFILSITTSLDFDASWGKIRKGKFLDSINLLETEAGKKISVKIGFNECLISGVLNNRGPNQYPEYACLPGKPWARDYYEYHDDIYFHKPKSKTNREESYPRYDGKTHFGL